MDKKKKWVDAAKTIFRYQAIPLWSWRPLGGGGFRMPPPLQFLSLTSPCQSPLAVTSIHSSDVSSQDFY